jgi:hypothetical protein
MPESPTLPAGAELGKSYEYGVDVDTSATETPSWTPVRRMFNFVPSPTAITQSAQTYDDFGAPNDDVSGWGWTVAFSVYVNRVPTTGLIPELKALFDRTRPESKGSAAVIPVRWYHKPEDDALIDPNDAFEGVATVAIVRGNTGPDGTNEMWNVTLTGKGPHKSITNPWTGWEPVVP